MWNLRRSQRQANKLLLTLIRAVERFIVPFLSAQRNSKSFSPNPHFRLLVIHGGTIAIISTTSVMGTGIYNYHDNPQNYFFWSLRV